MSTPNHKKRFGQHMCLFGSIVIEFPLVWDIREEVEKGIVAHISFHLRTTLRCQVPPA